SAAIAAVTHRQSLKRSAVLEFLIARLDFLAGERPETVYTELLAAEATHHRAVDHGAPQFFESDVPVRRSHALSGEVAYESAGERVACAGGIKDILQEVAGHHEMTATMEQDGAVFAALDHQDRWAHLHDLVGRAPQVVRARKQPRLAVIDQQEVPLFQG